VPQERVIPLSPRKITSASLLAGLRTVGTTARHIARTPSRLTVAVATTGTAGAIAAVALAAPWAGAASSAAASGPGPHATVKSAAVSDAAAKPAVAKPAAAKPAVKPTGPTTIYDSVTPTSIPAGQAEAVYADGAYQASSAQTAGHKTMWIDTNGSNTRANALDVEPGDATPAGAATWVSAKLAKDPGSTAIVYTFKSDWSQTQSDIDALPSWMHSHVKYWIADPTGSRHILPGAAATQWYWGTNYDITAAHPGFFQ
jgi:hypothetical protein